MPRGLSYGRSRSGFQVRGSQRDGIASLDIGDVEKRLGSSMSSLATPASPALAGVTLVAVMISLSGSVAT